MDKYDTSIDAYFKKSETQSRDAARTDRISSGPEVGLDLDRYRKTNVEKKVTVYVAKRD